MSPKPISPRRQWEQALVDAYYDHRWHQVLDPLYEKFQLWKASQLSHDDLDQAIHETHKQTRQVFTFFSEKRDWLVRAIEWDDEWYQVWVQQHPPPEALP